MVKPHKLGKTTRMSFSKIDEVLEIPNLLEVQKKSYQWFLDEGLREVLRDVSPIIDYSGNKYIEFVDYSIDEKTTDIKVIAKSALPKYESDEKKQFAISGLIQAYFFQLMDLVEDYYDYLDVKEIEREI